MMATIVHRGPDGDGAIVRPGVALGMRRLAVIDLLGGDQPIHNEDGTVSVVYNGEIYNFRELRRELTALGHRFATASDTEVITHGYEEWGDAVVDHLVGMFAFALVDHAADRLLVARDRFGKKPLYYARDGDRLLLGSEIKALLAAGVSADLDDDALQDYLALRYVPAPRTMFRAVRQLPAGHLMVSDRRGLTVRRWWRLEYGPKHEIDMDGAVDRAEELMRAAVEARMVSDVPLGCFLSGGLDSAVVLSFMAEASDRPVRTFSIGFDPSWALDELAAARTTAAAVGAHHREVRIGPADFLRMLPVATWHRDEPLAEPSEIPLMALARMAREDVTVVLSGEGGDELFGGYPKYRVDRALRRLGGPARGVLGARRVARIAMSPRVPRRARLACVALALGDERDRFPGWFGADRAAGLWARGRRPLAGLVAELSDGLGPLDHMMAVDVESYLADNLLVRGDKMTMAASLEARMPLLDHGLAEFAARLPERFKANVRHGKLVTRAIARRRLPAELLERPKIGFAVPVGRWFAGELGDALTAAAADPVSPLRDMVPAHTVPALLADHRAGRHDFGKELWSLLVLDIWGRIYLRGEDPQAITLQAVPA